MAESTVMEQIVSLCKRRGFIYPASEIYGGLNGFWDYGPLGVLLKNNIRDWWWHNMVITPPIGPDGHPIEIVGLDSSIIQNPKVWVASGHVGGFSDPMVDCRQCNNRFRADHVFIVGFRKTANPMADVSALLKQNQELQAELTHAIAKAQTSEDKARISQEFNALFAANIEAMRPILQKTVVAGSREEAAETAALTKRESKHFGDLQITAVLPLTGIGKPWPEFLQSPACPNCSAKDTLTEPRQFNLMFQTYVGAVQDDSAKAYLRPETAQGIFLNYKNVLDTMRVKVPFGVAQVGKSFRNEVTPRNFIFRSREFEQMEIEWFCHPDEARKWFDFWLAERMRWWRSLGVSEANLRVRQHEQDELSHYAKAGVGTADIEYRYPFTAPDYGELEGIAHRTDFDLRAHEQHSGQRLDYFDQELQLQLKEQGVDAEEIKRRSRYYPHVIEPASGLTRAVLVLLCEAFTPDESRPSKMYLKFDPKFAPIKCGIFPLVNKDGMPEVAERLYLELRKHFTCEYDAKQNIGKRYARNDEIGTPFCATIDGQTLQDQTVTIRDRDTMSQVRVGLDKVLPYLRDRLA